MQCLIRFDDTFAPEVQDSIKYQTHELEDNSPIKVYRQAVDALNNVQENGKYVALFDDQSMIFSPITNECFGISDQQILMLTSMLNRVSNPMF